MEEEEKKDGSSFCHLEGVQRFQSETPSIPNPSGHCENLNIFQNEKKSNDL